MAKAENKQEKETQLIQFGDKQFLETFNKYEAKQKELVKENPFIKVTDNETWEIGKQRRTALRTGRTSLENESKEVVRKINSFKDWVKGKYLGFVDISKDAEEKQQQSVKDFEAIKEAEKEKERELEQQRQDNIRSRIDDAEEQMTTSIQAMTYDTQKEVAFNVNQTIEQMDVDTLDEFSFLWNEAVDRVNDQLESQIQAVEMDEQRRLELLETERESKINGLYRQADEQIELLTFENAPTIKKEVNRIFDIDFDFGDKKEKFESIANQIFTKLDRRIEMVTQDHEQLQKANKKAELDAQRQRMVDVREGLLDLIFQIDVDNYKSQNELIGNQIKSVTGLDDELKPEWKKMLERIDQQLSQKMQFIDGQLKDRERKVEEHGKKVERREKELIELGFEKNESGITLDDDPDWTIKDDALWDMSDDEFDTYKTQVQEYLDQSKIQAERWNARKLELEKIGFEGPTGGVLKHNKIPGLQITTGNVLSIEKWDDVMDHFNKEIQRAKENDENEQKRQKALASDKENLIKAVESVRIQASEIQKMENNEMSDVLKDLNKSLETWKSKQIELIKNV